MVSWGRESRTATNSTRTPIVPCLPSSPRRVAHQVLGGVYADRSSLLHDLVDARGGQVQHRRERVERQARWREVLLALRQGGRGALDVLEEPFGRWLGSRRASEHLANAVEARRPQRRVTLSGRQGSDRIPSSVGRGGGFLWTAADRCQATLAGGGSGTRACCSAEPGTDDNCDTQGSAECCQIWRVGLNHARCATQPRRMLTEVGWSGSVDQRGAAHSGQNT